MDTLQYVEIIKTNRKFPFDGFSVNIENFDKSLSNAIIELANLSLYARKLKEEASLSMFNHNHRFNNCCDLPRTFGNYETGVKNITAILEIAYITELLLFNLRKTFQTSTINSEFVNELVSSMLEPIAIIASENNISMENLMIESASKWSKNGK